ncbi:bifunctional serine/threonine-protein kinase/formylglycine-generating enzyme family protein [Nostoc sp. CMAA1605]|uniref:bifunctional serine/threonine-protein kinase/formylglycine-generating enzyme family protein n=1 Tax=Nostoc sp. CMAA1605 TaxID=2055159 RepID=UPI001F45EC9F|nr:bifunctional serine/threonine-protein kinase/formylglycine-generating enzyme family protein [Nostoc sp. CMAA1605]MCF4966550.1 serine/threonine protein kinase [Nostoc sp. CMAA1605]
MNTLAGRYEIIRLLGGGGFAVTYLARDNFQPSKPLCVVKQLRPNQTATRVIEFFEKEAAILERLGKHPQIPQLLAHFNQDQNLYIVQEFVEGQDLSREIVPGKRLSESYVTRLLQDALEVLSFVHQQGVIHRDIKPQNLMRQQDGKIILIDFGAVKELGTLMINSQGEVNSSVVIGTPGYMSYEQYRGKPCCGSDIYALGMTAIQALTGVLPSELEEDSQTGEIIWQNRVQVSNHLAEVLTKMVRHHFSMRYANATEALQALISVSASLPPTVVSEVNKELYLQEARSRAQQSQGNFSVFALRILESRRVELGLSEEEAREIQAQVLQPYREYERKLQEYEQALIDAVTQQYPFSQGTQKDLQDYKQYLGLKDEDIAAIEARVFPPQQSELQRQQQEAERLRQEQQRQAELQRQQREAERLRQQQQQQKKASQPISNLGIPTQTFEFDTAIVTLKSIGFLGSRTKEHEIQRIRKQNLFYRETLVNGVVLDMVAIPGGKFLMGSPEDEPERSKSESPQHNVTVKPFFMGKFPVTQAQWKAVASLSKVKIDLNPDPSHFKGANRPVETVSWDDAVEFCTRLSQKTGKIYRLPSEAEWEYACRAGTKTPFYVGDTIATDVANYNGNFNQTTDVGTFPANNFGLFDMCGNTWEWCQDEWHENYNQAPVNGNVWASNNQYKVLRGGSWNGYSWYCRSACRFSNVPQYRYYTIGFRLVGEIAVS